MNNLKGIKNSTLLAELKRRLKLGEIRFNEDYHSDYGIIYTGLISWNSLDEYELDFTETEVGEEQTQAKFGQEFNK